MLTNKTPQEAVRGFGQAPTNFALERTIDRVARHLNMDRIELRAEEPHPQGRVSVPDPERLDLRLRRLPRRARQGARRDRLSGAASHERDAARRAGQLAGIGISTCLEPSGGNSAFEPLLNPKNETTTWMDSCLVRVDLSGAITGVMGTSSSGQGHETLVSTVIGEVLERDPADIRVVHADSLKALPSNSPVGSRMAIMLGGAAAGAARKIKDTLIAIAAHNLECADGGPRIPRRQCQPCEGVPEKRMTLGRAGRDRASQDSIRCRRASSRGCRRNSSGRCRPAADCRRADGRVQIYPCYAFEAHVVYVEIDPDTAAPTHRAICLRPRLRRDDQPRHRARHDLWRHRARHRRRALRKIHLHRRRPARERHVHGLPDAERAGSADDHDRRPLHALAADDVRPEGLGRSRLSRRARRDRQCDQRRARAARRASSTRCRCRTTRCGRSFTSAK